MCLPINKAGFVVLICGLMYSSAMAVAPEDEQVSAFLEEHGLDDLLEVQLFDRFTNERDGTERFKIAQRLAGVYMESLADENLSEDQRRDILLKGKVLVGLMPQDELLELRLELLIQRYSEHERASDLDRIGLLSDESREFAIASLAEIVPELKKISVVAGIQEDQLNRTAARTNGEEQVENERKLALMRSVNSRAHFILGWAGYSEAVLREMKVSNDVLSSFGWVLGFDGKSPVLDQMDIDLLEYDHVARAMLGVALSKLQNGDTYEARSWFAKIVDAPSTPEFAVNFAQQRILETMLLELDWSTSLRQAIFLRDFEPESLLEVAQARLLVLRTLGTKAGGAYGQRGNGGQEGATELAKMGLERLIELGEIGHILDLQRRFGTLPLLNSGFVSFYTQGLAEVADGDAGGGDGAYAQASLKLGQSLQASDVERYLVHAADAALKLAYCQMRLGKPGEAAAVLDRNSALFVDDELVEEAAWLKILAHDSAVQAGQDQLSERLSVLIAEYIRSYPSTERANTLVVRFAMTPHLQGVDAVSALVIEDPADPLALIARRKYIQVLYKNPDLVADGRGNHSEQLYGEIIKHAHWVWEYEADEAVNLREGRERLAVLRIVLSSGMGVESPDVGLLARMVTQSEQLMESMPALNGSASEIEFRRIQLALLQGQIEQAGELAMSSTVLEDSVASAAMGMVFEAADSRFDDRQTVPNAQAVIRYGRRVLDEWRDGSRVELDRRHSEIAEAMAEAAVYLGGELGDATMREYGFALSLEVFEHGVPSTDGLIRTAVVGESLGEAEVAIQCWLMLVARLPTADERWHRARYESFRLLKASDAARADTAFAQYVVLYPDGSPEPWGERIRAMFLDSEVGAP